MYKFTYEVLNKYFLIIEIFYDHGRAKTIKNVVSVNEELTAEEWKRRYEREKDKVSRLRGKLERAEEELERWRIGESVSGEEQVALRDDSAPTPSADPGMSLKNSNCIKFLLLSRLLLIDLL